jgi:hypothetical protein
MLVRGTAALGGVRRSLVKQVNRSLELCLHDSCLIVMSGTVCLDKAVVGKALETATILRTYGSFRRENAVGTGSRAWRDQRGTRDSLWKYSK